MGKLVEVSREDGLYVVYVDNCEHLKDGTLCYRVLVEDPKLDLVAWGTMTRDINGNEKVYVDQTADWEWSRWYEDIIRRD